MDYNYLKKLENKFIEDNQKLLNKDLLKIHYKKIIELINPIITDNKKLILDEYKDRLINHLFILSSFIEYIPSYFIKLIAEISCYLHTLEWEGILKDLKSFKSTEFLTNYYKTISIILKNKYIKEEKKQIFEKIVCQKLTENTVEWLLSNFSQPNKIIDNKAKIMLKAITQSKFEFFETFAVNFKKAIFELITSSKDKKYLNKYIFKIIEKCVARLNNIEKDLLYKLNKISQNIVEIFLKQQNLKIKKLFRSSLRIIYCIYDKTGYSNRKIIAFFKAKFMDLLEFDDLTIPFKFKENVLKDFIEVNFKILQKKVDLLDYYNFFYSLTLNMDENSKKICNEMVYLQFYNSFLESIEKLFKYEISLQTKNHFYEMAYIKLLHNVFNMFYSDSIIHNEKKKISIEILCRIIQNSNLIMKINIIEEITFSHISFFSETSNCQLLDLLIQSIKDSIIKSDKIYDYYTKYLEILFIHSIKKNFSTLEFLRYIYFLIDKIDNYRIFLLGLNFSKKYLLYLDEESIGQVSQNPLIFKIIIGFLEILTKTSGDLSKMNIGIEVMHEILNIYSIFIIIKIFNIPKINFSKDQIITFNENDDTSIFVFYLLIFAQNIPPLLFNRNTSVTNPVKVDLKLSILNLLSEKTKSKVLSNEFDDFGDKTKGLIRNLDYNSQLYLLGIYISLVAKVVFFRIFSADEKEKIQDKEFLKNRLSQEKILNEKISIINLLKYLTDNKFLYDKIMEQLFIHIFERFLDKYMVLLKKYYNTKFKHVLIANDLRNLLNYCCFYHNTVREIALKLIKIYANDFPFLLNEYKIFEYYVNILGILISNTIQPFDYFIKKIQIDSFNLLELPSEQDVKENIYSKLYQIFEQCLQKSHIINNNNIAYNIANYVNKCTLLYQGSIQPELNYSINILQKIYNSIKKVEISSFLKTSAYLDPIKFEAYLKKNVYNNFDKYVSISAVQDLHNFTDYAKSTILQIRNKYMGIVEGKINNLKLNYKNDEFYKHYKLHNIQSNNEIILNDYCFYRIMKDFNQKIFQTFNENSLIGKIDQEIFAILVELTSFMVYVKINEFKTTFDKQIMVDEIFNLITFIPIFLASSKSIEAGVFCWEWILYFNKKLLAFLLSNIILSIKCLKNYINIKTNFFIGTEETKKSDIFDVVNNLKEIKLKKIKDFESLRTNVKKSNSSTVNYDYNNFNNDKFIHMINEKAGQNLDLNDYIFSQIVLLKFLKECVNELCKCDLEKLILIFDILKLYVDLSINESLYLQSHYIYLHFFICNISLEIIKIFEENVLLFEYKVKQINEFKCLLYLFGFSYFEFDKQRRIITNKVLLGEIEQTLINCVELIAQDKYVKDSFSGLTRKNTKLFKKITTFVYSIEQKQKNIGQGFFKLFDNIKNLIIYLIESEINNMRYWNSPSTFHIQNTKYIPTSMNMNQERVKEIFQTAFSISNKLSIKLVQRYPFIEKKFTDYINRLGQEIYINRKVFYNQSLAFKYLIDYMKLNHSDDLKDLKMMKIFLFWRFPSLNYALKYISLGFEKMKPLHRFSILMLENARKSAILFYMSELIQSIRTNTCNYVEKYILKISKHSSMIAHQLLWSLEVEEIVGPKSHFRFLPENFNENVFKISELIRHTILKNFGPMERKFWLDVSSQFNTITEISGKFLHLDENPKIDLKMTKIEKTDYVRKELAKLPNKFSSHIYLPTNPDTKILDIIVPSAISLQSAKKVPFLVSFTAIRYDGPDSDPLISESIETFICNEKYVLEMFGTNLNNFNRSNTNLLEFGGTSKQVKSTNNTNLFSNYINYEENKENMEMENLFNRNELYADDEGFILDEQDKNKEFSIPHLNIKLFKESLIDNIKQTDIIDEKDIQLEINLQDLSNCTDLTDDELFQINKINKKRVVDKRNINSHHDHNILSKKEFNISCVFKVGDDLRQDSLALQIIQIFKEIFHEHDLKLFVFPYKTISTITSAHKDLGGLIECVPDCDSRDQIGKTYETNLYEYFLCTFGQENSDEFRRARKNFIESLAAYCVISYILQIKDRHNGNILIDKNGHIIHIDFGFIFDISPGGNMRFEKAAFKLTKEMIQIMGHSTKSEPYQMFVDLTIRGFLASRDYMDKLLDPVVLMFNAGLECFRENSIKNFIERFKLDLNEDEAAMYMRNLIDIAENNWRTNVYDWIQNKQNNINY